MGKLANLALDSLPTFKCLIPSTGKTVLMRSFVVKEQKLLLIAKQSEGEKLDGIIGAINQLISNCIVNSNLEVYKLPSFDIEYMFVQLYMHSLGTTKTKAFYRCLNPIKDAVGADGKPDPTAICGEANGIVIDLKAATVKTSEIRDGVIEVNSSSISKLVLEYPSFEQITQHDLAVADEKLDETFRIYAECLKYVYKADGTMMQLGEDYDIDDAIELMEMLPQAIFEKVLSFFVNTPTISSSTPYKCRKCGCESTIELRGLEDFF